MLRINHWSLSWNALSSESDFSLLEEGFDVLLDDLVKKQAADISVCTVAKRKGYCKIKLALLSTFFQRAEFPYSFQVLKHAHVITHRGDKIWLNQGNS